MNVWYVNSILGTFRLEEENDAICGLTLCPDGVPELEPLPRKVCETPLLQEAEELFFFKQKTAYEVTV